MTTLDEINEDWQVNGLSPTWVKLQQAKQEQEALIAERDALKAELERIKALPPVAWLSTDCIGERYLAFGHPLDNDPVEPLYALGSKTA